MLWTGVLVVLATSVFPDIQNALYAVELIRSGIEILSQSFASVQQFRIGRALFVCAITGLVILFSDQDWGSAGFKCFRRSDLAWGMSLLGSTVAAVLISTAMFASYHIYQGWEPTIGIFAIGILWAIAFCKLRTIWPLVVAHATADFVAFL